MEIIAPNLHSRRPPFIHTFTLKISCNTPSPPLPTHLPLHRPEYKPPRPIKVKPIHDPKLKPVSTTSDILRLMDSLKLTITPDVYITLIKECTKFRDPVKAVELYRHLRNSKVQSNLPLLNRLLLMYVSCCCFDHAHRLFDQMSVRDFNSWAVIIAGCVENSEYNKAVRLFIDMICNEEFENLCDQRIEFLVSGVLMSVLKACRCTKDVELGMQVHGWLWKMGYSKNATLCSFLINFYGKLKCSEDAQSVSQQSCCTNTVVWTSKIDRSQ